MKSEAQVAVIGGGVIGASIAWHLAKRGVRDVLILDAAPARGAGSTGRATGGFRAQFATAINVRLSLAAREKLVQEFGEDLDALWEHLQEVQKQYQDRVVTGQPKAPTAVRRKVS